MELRQKVGALLGAILKPLPKDFVLWLCQLDYESLSTEGRELVDAIFTSKDIVVSEAENHTYTLSNEAKEKLEHEVDMSSVNSAIANVLWGEMDAEFNNNNPT